MPPQSATEWPLTARGPELAAVAAALTGGGAFITGDPGTGKTRLLHAALDTAARAGHTVRRLPGPLAPGPDGSLGDLHDEHADVHGESAPGAAERREPWRARGLSGVDGEPGGGRGGFFTEPFEAYGDPLGPYRTETGGDPPSVVVGVDDVHLVEPGVAERLHALVRAGRVVLVAAAPAGAAVPRGITRLWLDRLVERVDIGAFDRTGTAEVLRAGLGGHVSEAALERLWSLTRGNARFLRELVDSALEAGTLRTADGNWQWPGPAGPPSPRLAEAVRQRLGPLDPDEAELAALIALAEPLEVGLAPVEAHARAAESLNRRGIVVAERTGRRLLLRLAYPLYGPVLLGDLPELGARRLRLRLADAIEATGMRRADDGARVVSLRLAAGQAPPPAQLGAAAEAALRRHDFPLAERLSGLALSGSGPAGTGDAAQVLLARALAGQGRHQEAEDLFGRADGGAAERAVNLAWGLRRVDDAVAVVTAGLAGRPWDHGLLAARSVLRLLQDRTGEAADVRALDRDPALAPALVPPAALARIERGDAAGALTLLRQVRPVLDGWDAEPRLAAGLLTARAAFQSGETAELVAALGDMRRYGVGRRGEIRVAVMRARTYRSAGRFTEAVDLLRRACALEDRSDWFTTPAWTLAQLAGALAEAGQHAEAVWTMVEARTAQERSVAYPLAVDGAALEHALVLAHVGDPARAVRRAQRVAVRAAAAGRIAQAVTAWHLAARVGAPGPSAARLAGLLTPDPARGYLDLLAAHVRALAECDGDALDSVADRFAALGVLPVAAEAAAQAARVHQTAGRHRRSRTARVRCAELLAGGELPPWVAPSAPWPYSSGATPQLTAREREVASLAASRLSNQEIADRLVVSVRTVENHLHRVYGKLGVTARTELARRL